MDQVNLNNWFSKNQEPLLLAELTITKVISINITRESSRNSLIMNPWTEIFKNQMSGSEKQAKIK